MAVSPRPRMTVEDWLTFPDDGLRTELIHGEVVVASAATKRHQLIVGRLWAMLETHCREHGGGQAYIDVNLALTLDTCVRPDLIFVREGEDNPEDPLVFRGPPALVAEVVSDPAHDLGLKLRLYEELGVREYWAIWQEPDRIEVYRLGDGGYGKPRIVEPGETLSPLVLPSIAIDVADLLRR